jgi:hypothetical protein
MLGNSINNPEDLVLAAFGGGGSYLGDLGIGPNVTALRDDRILFGTDLVEIERGSVDITIAATVPLTGMVCWGASADGR